MYAGKTGDQYRAEAAANRAASLASFERCDTDGSVTQWANDTLARELELKAEIADDGGMIEIDALFLVDGRLASADLRSGDYGPYYLLNDAATAVFGKRFYSPSKAQKAAIRRRNNAAKGFTIGTVRIAAYVTLSGSGTGLSGALSVRPVALPDRDALRSGNVTVVGTDTDTDTGDY